MLRDVIIAGVGTLGSEVARKLGQLECRSVFLADPDVIEARNQSRSVLLRGSRALGRKKVEVLLERLAGLFPETQWTGSAIEIADVDESVLSNAQMIFSCVDSDLGRTEIAALSSRFNVPVCDAGLGGVSTGLGRVSWLPGGKGACFSCLLTSRRRTSLLDFWETDVRSCVSLDSISPVGWTTTPSTAAVTATLQVETGFRSMRSPDAFSLSVDLNSIGVIQKIRHFRCEACPFHEQAEGSDLTFPICASAECLDCGAEYSPDRRIAWVRRYGACPACASRKLAIRKTVRTSGGGLEGISA